MSIFEALKNAIFHHAAPASSKGPASTQTSPTAATRPGAPSAGNPGAATQQGTSPSSAAATPSQPVDIEAGLEKLNAAQAQKLNWRTSIVDLMKLVGMDSGLQHRKDLAKELGYTGDTNDSAAMNVWLHKEVMKKLAANGGKVPSSLS